MQHNAKCVVHRQEQKLKNSGPSILWPQWDNCQMGQGSIPSLAVFLTEHPQFYRKSTTDSSNVTLLMVSKGSNVNKMRGFHADVSSNGFHLCGREKHSINNV